MTKCATIYLLSALKPVLNNKKYTFLSNISIVCAFENVKIIRKTRYFTSNKTHSLQKPQEKKLTF